MLSCLGNWLWSHPTSNDNDNKTIPTVYACQAFKRDLLKTTLIVIDDLPKPMDILDTMPIYNQTNGTEHTNYLAWRRKTEAAAASKCVHMDKSL